MHITHLSLTNFRNYGRLELELSPGTTLLYGQNAQGKTNLLEAVYYLATTRSAQADYDYQLLNWEAAQREDPVVVGRLVAQIATQTDTHLLEMRLIQERNGRNRRKQGSFRREALLDRRKVRLMDLIGNLRVVMFLPEDVQLISGSPSERRRYMNITLCQIDPVYCRTLSGYNKVLEQRNALLRQIAEGSTGQDLLPIYTDKLVQLGTQIFARRSIFLKNMARETQRIHYEDLTAGQESMRLHYLPRLEDNRRHNDADTVDTVERWLQKHEADTEAIAARFLEAVNQAQTSDLARGSTSIGPHRDDWQFLLNGRDLSNFGSRGQQRTAILALKIAEINWMQQMTGETPILLLDEVVAELDAQRRAALLQVVRATSQALLTATDPGMFPPDFLDQATTLRVVNGRLEKTW